MTYLQGGLQALWRFVGRVSFRVKVMGIAVGSVLVLGLGVTLHMQQVMQQITDETLVRQGRAVARWVAGGSQELVLTENAVALHRLLSETIASEPSVRYIYLISRNGRIIDHTFGNGFPRGLSLVNPLPAGADVRWLKLETNEGPIWDVAVPVLPDGGAVVHVGVSPSSLQAIANEATVRHMAATGLVAALALLVAFFVTGLPTRAVRELVAVTQAVTAGQLGQRAQVWAQDELGKLAMSFNAMSERLASAYDALNRRNQQLALLNRLGMRLIGEKDAASLSVSVLRAGMGLLGAHGGRLWIASNGGLEPNLTVGRIEDETPIDAEKAWAHGRSLYTASPSGKGLVLVPLTLEDQIMGLLEFEVANEPTPDDLSLADLLGQQAALSLSNARLWKDLEERESARRHLLARAIAAQEEERRRIARELHDETSQSLSRLLLEVDRIMLSDSNQGSILQVRELAVSALSQLRNLAVELRPSVLDEVGLVPAVARYLEGLRERTGLSVDFHTLGTDDLRLIPPVEITVYRIVQEACLNVVRHARASSVSVLMERRAEELRVIVEDDGVGFDVQEVTRAPVERRLGILGMEERAKLIGASLTVESWPGSGTTVYLRVPLYGNTPRTAEDGKDSYS